MALSPLILTVDVENGSDVIEVSDATILTDLNCPPPAQVSIDGKAFSVAARLSTTTFQLSRNWPDATATDLDCEIAPFTPEMADRSNLTKTVLEYSAKLALLDAQGHGLFYKLSAITGAGDPGPGLIARDNSDWSSVTELYFDVLGANAVDQTAIIDRWGNGTDISVQSIETSAFALFAMTGPATNEGPDAWRQIVGLEYKGGAGALADDEAIRVVHVQNGTGLAYDERVATLAERDGFDGSPAETSVFVQDIGDGRGAVYFKDSAAAADWSSPTYVTGPVGATGPRGWTPLHDVVKDGLRVVEKLASYTGGEGDAPTTNIGKYRATAGGYTETIALAMDIRGEHGRTWLYGIVAPEDGNGVDGDLYFNSATSDVYVKAAGAWGAASVNLKGPKGDPGNDGILSAVQNVKAAETTLVVGDNGQSFISNSETAIPINFDPAATLGVWGALIKNEGAGLAILTPDGEEKIDGKDSLNLETGDSLLVLCDGTSLRTWLAGSSSGAPGAGGNVISGGLGEDDIPMAVAVASSGGEVLELPSGFIDPFADESMVDGAASSGADYDAGEGQYAPTEIGGGNDEYTKLLLHFDGADASTTITDDNSGGAAHAWTVGGNAQINGNSLLLDGAGDFVTTPDHADFSLGAGDFTIDCKFDPAGGFGTTRYLGGQSNSGGTGTTVAWGMYCDSSNRIVVRVNNAPSITGTTVIDTAGEHHVALVRNGDVMHLYLDGIEEGSTALVGTVLNSGNSVSIGRMGDLASSTWFGSIDEFRISIGIARWTSDFTPPTIAYSDTIEYQNQILISEPFSASEQADLGSVVVQAQSDDAITTNVDLVAKITRDGATWSTGVLKAIVEQSSGAVIYAAINIDLTSQPAGTALRYRIETPTGKNIKLRAGGLFKSKVNALGISTLADHDELLIAMVAAEAKGNRILFRDGVADAFDTLVGVDVAGATNLDTSETGVLKPKLLTSDTGTLGQSQTLTRTFGNPNGLNAGFQFIAPADAVVSAVTIDVDVVNTTGDLRAELWSDASDSPDTLIGVASTTLDVVSLGDKELVFPTPPAITSGATYWIVFVTSNGLNINVSVTSNQAGYGSGRGDVITDLSPTSLPSSENFRIGIAYSTGTSDLTVTSKTISAVNQPVKLSVVVELIESESVEINTDVLLYLSRDDGGVFTEVGLAAHSTQDNGNVVYSGDVDVSDQPAGSLIKWRIHTAAKSVKIKGIAVREQIELDVILPGAVGALQLPSGTESQRPTAPKSGMVRYNTDYATPEIFLADAWAALAIGKYKYGIEYLLVAEGGAGFTDPSGNAGGGGAGGLLAGSFQVEEDTNYPIVIGDGGAVWSDGDDSTFAGLTAIGGGRGGRYLSVAGYPGGSGGGGGQQNSAGGAGTDGQGNAGGASVENGGGGGGGAGAAGDPSHGTSGAEGGDGGDGLESDISGVATYYAGGGGGSSHNISPGVAPLGGLGGGGGGHFGGNPGTAGVAGTDNTGGGGGAGGESGAGGLGGSGVLIIRYAGTQKGTGGVVTAVGGYTIHTFTEDGAFIA